MRWVLDASSAPVSPEPVLDADQQRVVDHREGNLLVLAGPGTGKTTTIVEAICARLADRVDPLAPAQVLALTFGRKAAGELRERVVGRLGGGVVPTVATFHSFAYGLVRQTDSLEGYLTSPRLMSGAEEDVRIRELLRGAVADGSIDWPDDLMGALPTLGLANEVRAVLSRARELGLQGSDLRRIGTASGRPAWVGVGQLASQEQDVMGFENVLDYTELLFQALLRLSVPQVAASLQGRYRAIYVDEYQDTDRLQVALLKALAGARTSVVAVGDPDQAIYGFRGADVRGILRFPRAFADAAGVLAPVAVLGTTRRFGPNIREASSVVLGNRLPPGLPIDQARAHRTPACAPRPPDQDVVSIRTYDDHGAQGSHIARELRLAHVDRGVGWQQMAVLVRTGHQIPAIQRALAVAGVPVVIAADEIPLRSEPAVATLLAALRLATTPGQASASDVIDVLTGPLVGLTASDIRRVGRALRAEHKEAGNSVPPSDELIRELVLGVPTRGPIPVDDPLTHTVGRLRILLAEVHRQIEGGATPQDVLWTVWTGGSAPHGWPQRLRAAALEGSRPANHDLDAVMALFDTAERLSGRYPGFLGVRMFLDSLKDQQIPAEPVADRGTHAEAVRVLTAHRAKGLEWDEVWVIGLQEGVWPDLRARGSTLRAEELTATGVGTGPRAGDLLEEERRLFYVACTRARTHLHVSAVESADEGGDRPSRFFDDLAKAGYSPVHTSGRPAHSVSLTGLVSELRAAATDQRSAPVLRDAARTRLALLAAQHDDDGRALVPLADPQRWWGLNAITEGPLPVRDPDRPISLSGSGLDGILACPMKWFLEHEAHAETARGTATSFGSVVHAIADFVAKGDIPESLDDMDAQVERIWGELRFEARWQSVSERREARAALGRFLEYHVRKDRELVDTEAAVGTEVVVPLPAGGDENVRLRGFIDRVERDADGRMVAIDLKNMRRGVPDKEIPQHGQLGVYQLILREAGLRPRVEESALDGTDGTDGTERPGDAEVERVGVERVAVGGAALVQLRVPAGKGSSDPKVQFQDALGTESPTWVELRLGAAAEVLRTESFPATLGSACRYCAYSTSCPAKPAGEQVVM
jgi:superfamily I DNA/RNA helicase/RecB family exonuclease